MCADLLSWIPDIVSLINYKTNPDIVLMGSVMAVQFVPKTHYIFSAGKDGVVKYWDADKFELLLTLEGHHAEVWCLAVSSHGDFLVTGSHDRSIRRWDRTEEPFFIEVGCLPCVLCRFLIMSTLVSSWRHFNPWCFL